MTLVEFLEARIAQDEAMWDVMSRTTRQVTPETLRTLAREVNDLLVYEPDAYNGNAGLNLWERGLRECAAKRAIIAVCEYELTGNNGPSSAVTAELTMQALASVYSDHPDYDPTWSLT